MTETTPPRRPLTKTVIPAAGMGTRFLPASKAIPKEMIPVIDKPTIQYVVEEAVAVGLTDVTVVTARGKGSIEDHFDVSPDLERALEAGSKHAELAQVRWAAEMADVHFVRQAEAKGLGHAVACARHHVGDDPFVVQLGDDIMVNTDVLSGMLDAYARYGCSVVAVREVEKADISKYGCVDPGQTIEDGLVNMLGIVEKPSPDEAPSNLAVTGRYLFTPKIFEMIDRTPPGKGGEIQLTDAISLLIAEEPVYAFVFDQGRYDVGNKLDYLRATVEIALSRDDIGPSFREYLRELVRQWR